MTEVEKEKFEDWLQNNFSQYLPSRGTAKERSRAMKRFCEEFLWELGKLKCDGNEAAHEKVRENQIQNILDVVYSEEELKIHQS